MRVQHNIMAMNSYRNYNNNTSSINKNIEKLSSGYQINRAGDNAAGLAISEKMRAQITGLEVAQKNAKDGISLVQTAEGALTEIHSMLNRMYELAEQSANGTYSNDVDRVQLQKEVASLKTEIDRIADSANFNGTKLLNGDLSANPAVGLSGETGTAANLTDTSNISDIDLTNSKAAKDGADIKFGVMAQGTGDAADVKVSIGDTNYVASLSSANFDSDGNLPDTLELANASDADDKITITLSDDGKTALKNAITADADGAEAASIGLNSDGDAIEGASIGSVKTGAADAADGADDADAANEGGFTAADGEQNVSNIDMGSSTATGDVKVGWTTTGANAATVTVKVGDTAFTTAVTDASSSIQLEDSDGNQITLTLTTAGVAALGQAVQNDEFTDTGDIDVDAATAAGTVTAAQQQDDGDGDKDASLQDASNVPSNVLKLQIGDDSATYNQIHVSIDNMHVANLGKYTPSATSDDGKGLDYKVTQDPSNNSKAPTTIADIDISSQDGAAVALDVIKGAIDYVSDTRGGLGAIQNRLEHTINNLSVMQENMQDAESTIRDTDVAAEMMKYTKNSILVQSAQAMLAQANQQPQGVLQLLQ